METPVATVVSMQPFALHEDRPGLYPGDFTIPPASPDEPRFLVIRAGQIRMMDQDFRPFMMEEDRMLIAKDVAEGHNRSLIGFSPTTQPAVFAVPGEITSKEQLLAKHGKLVAERVEWQRNYFKVLVSMADDDWRRNKQLRHINDVQRAAARFLNLDREWLLDDIDSTMKCPACMSTVSRLAAVCFACRAILDVDKYTEMRFHNDSQNVVRMGSAQPLGEETEQGKPQQAASAKTSKAS